MHRLFFHLLLVTWVAAAAIAADPADLLKGFRRGANLGNYLEAPRIQNWGATYNEKDFANIDREGFDHVRIPIRWNDYTGPAPDFKIEGAFYEKVDFLVTNAVLRGLSVIINIHHFDEFTTDPEANQEKFFALWRQIAAHYSNQPPAVAFELLNEPKDAAATQVMNPIYETAVRFIRESNPSRRIFVGPGKWNSLDEVENLKLPKGDSNIVATVHSYEPFYFTHQGASWTMPDTATKGIKYPGPPEKPVHPHPAVTNKTWIVNWFKGYNNLPAAENPSGLKAFKDRMEMVREWSLANKVPIHVGEFGAYTGADPESRARFYKDMRETSEALGFGWCIWDWKAGFRYWDGDEPAPGMRQALFGE